MTFLVLTIDQLCVSPFNARQNVEDQQPTEALLISIEARGLIIPLIVHHMDGAEGLAEYGVLDGGRRYRTIRQLVDEGRLPADWPIIAVLRDGTPAEITEESVAAFLLARGLRDYEISAAVAQASERGDSIDEIARALGQTPRTIMQHLRLGNLDPEIFAAYSAEQLSLDQARAYAATEDHALQRAAFAHFRRSLSWQHSAHNIRAWMKVGDREMQRLLTFVGADVYRAAGGRFELDLFADGPEDRGRVADEGKLREMVENKLGHIRASLRIRTGRSDLRFAAEPPKFLGQADITLEFRPRSRKGKGEEESKITLPDGDTCVTLTIDDAGEPEIRYWWASRKAKRDAEKAPATEGSSTAAAAPASKVNDVPVGAAFDRYTNHAQQARAELKDEHGLTADGAQVIRSLRRQLLRALLVGDAEFGGSLGRDYLVWSQLRQALEQDRWQSIGARGMISDSYGGLGDDEPRDVVQPHLQACEATAIWERAVTTLRQQDFMTLKDPAEAYAAFTRQPEPAKDMAGAVLAGLALVRSANAAGWRIAVHDRLAGFAGADAADLRRLWHPTEAFVGLFPRMKRLEHAQDAGADASELKRLTKLKDRDSPAPIAAGLAANPRWIHPLLSFGNAPAPAGLKEAAE